MNKTFLITGASSGIGAEIAKHLANGNRIIIHYNSSKEKASTVADAVTERGGKAHLIQANLSTQQGCEEVAKFVKEQIPNQLDCLINNAGGIIKQHQTEGTTWDCIENLFHLNTFSTIYLSSLCIPLMKPDSNASIINITSTIIRSGGTVGPIYAASKGAIDVFTRSLAREVAPDIRVNAIAPGVIETPFHDVTPDKKMQEVIQMTPLKKTGQPNDIAQVVAMLIENTFITGETIDVNGGLYMR